MEWVEGVEGVPRNTSKVEQLRRRWEPRLPSRRGGPGCSMPPSTPLQISLPNLRSSNNRVCYSRTEFLPIGTQILPLDLLSLPLSDFPLPLFTMSLPPQSQVLPLAPPGQQCPSPSMDPWRKVGQLLFCNLVCCQQCWSVCCGALAQGTPQLGVFVIFLISQ